MESLNYREVDGEILPPYGPDYEIESEPYDEEFYYDQMYRENLDRTNGIDKYVNLQVRREALLKASDMYAEAASHRHFVEKSKDSSRYDGLVNHFKDYSFSDEKRMLAPAIGVDGEAWVKGDLPADTELIALTSLIDIRKSIGKSVGAKKRNEMRKTLKGESSKKSKNNQSIDYKKYEPAKNFISLD